MSLVDHTTGAAARPFDLWGGTGYCSTDAVGEFYRQDNVERVIRGRGGNLRSGGTIELPMAIVREPTNQADPNAVAVLADGIIVGYIARTDAFSYHDGLNRLASRGRTARVDGQISWWGQEYGDPNYDVRLDLGPPSTIVPVNDEPPGVRLLPAGRQLQVKELPEALPFLAELVGRSPWNEASAWGVLRNHTDPKGKDLALVVIDDTPVGTLTPQSSSHYTPIVRWGTENGIGIATRVTLVGNQLDVQVTTHAAKASELPADWLQAPRQTVAAAAPAPAPVAAAPPAGWYVDPMRRNQLRYWDGAAWTAYVSSCSGCSTKRPE